MKAYVKKMRLPDAPEPTRASNKLDPYEAKYLRSLVETPHLHDGFKPRPHERWTPSEIETMKRLWMEGKTPKQIANAMGKEIKQTSNKLGYLVYKGELQKKRTALVAEEKAEIRKAHKNGESIESLCNRFCTGERLIRRTLKEQ